MFIYLFVCLFNYFSGRRRRRRCVDFLDVLRPRLPRSPTVSHWLLLPGTVTLSPRRGRVGRAPSTVTHKYKRLLGWNLESSTDNCYSDKSFFFFFLLQLRVNTSKSGFIPSEIKRVLVATLPELPLDWLHWALRGRHLTARRLRVRSLGPFSVVFSPGTLAPPTVLRHARSDCLKLRLWQ